MSKLAYVIGIGVVLCVFISGLLLIGDPFYNFNQEHYTNSPEEVDVVVSLVTTNTEITWRDNLTPHLLYQFPIVIENKTPAHFDIVIRVTIQHPTHNAQGEGVGTFSYGSERIKLPRNTKLDYTLRAGHAFLSQESLPLTVVGCEVFVFPQGEYAYFEVIKEIPCKMP